MSPRSIQVVDCTCNVLAREKSTMSGDRSVENSFTRGEPLCTMPALLPRQIHVRRQQHCLVQ